MTGTGVECKFYQSVNKRFNSQKLDWFLRPRGFKRTNKDANIYVGRSRTVTVNNLSIRDQTQCINYITKTFYRLINNTELN